jgi:hypothetical protein
MKEQLRRQFSRHDVNHEYSRGDEREQERC